MSGSAEWALHDTANEGNCPNVMTLPLILIVGVTILQYVLPFALCGEGAAGRGGGGGGRGRKALSAAGGQSVGNWRKLCHQPFMHACLLTTRLPEPAQVQKAINLHIGTNPCLCWETLRSCICDQ